MQKHFSETKHILFLMPVLMAILLPGSSHAFTPQDSKSFLDGGGDSMRPYLGIGAADFQFDIGSVYGTSNVAGVVVKTGVEIHRYFAVEARFCHTGDADFNGTQVIAGVPVLISGKARVNLFSLFGRAQIPFGEGFQLYALAGGTHGSGSVDFTASVVGLPSLSFSGSGSDNSFSYGVGGEYRSASGFSFDVEYMKYFSDISSVGGGIAYHF